MIPTSAGPTDPTPDDWRKSADSQYADALSAYAEAVSTDAVRIGEIPDREEALRYLRQARAAANLGIDLLPATEIPKKKQDEAPAKRDDPNSLLKQLEPSSTAEIESRLKHTLDIVESDLKKL